MEVYSGRDDDLDLEKMARECYRYVNKVRRILLGRIFPSEAAVRTPEQISDAFYSAGNRRINGIDANVVLSVGSMKLPLSETRDLCFKRNGLGPDYFVYVEERKEEG